MSVRCSWARLAWYIVVRYAYCDEPAVCGFFFRCIQRKRVYISVKSTHNKRWEQRTIEQQQYLRYKIASLFRLVTRYVYLKKKQPADSAAFFLSHPQLLKTMTQWRYTLEYISVKNKDHNKKKSCQLSCVQWIKHLGNFCWCVHFVARFRSCQVEMFLYSANCLSIF